jgi:hypothetical protein
MAAASTQQQGAIPTALVEEKHFRVRLERSAPLLKGAIEDALGCPLEELAPGMWFAKRPTGRVTYEEITVRALETEEGTSVEVRIESHTTPLGISAFITGILVGTMFILPLFYLIAVSQSKQKEAARARLVQMHKVWTEVSAAVGAPMKSGYRSGPERARARVRARAAAEDEEDELEDEEQEEEALLPRHGDEDERSA